MSILAECPLCRKRQSLRNRKCACGADLVKAKQNGKVRYWINYRLPDGRQRRESVGFSIEEARDAEGKRRGQKRENRIFDIVPEARMTFSELSEWYLNLRQVKAKKYHDTIKYNLDTFLEVFGERAVNTVNLSDLEDFQQRLKDEGKADATIDYKIGAARTMLNYALDNEKIGPGPLVPFRKIKKLCKGNANARRKILPLDQFYALLDALPLHTRGIIATAFYTGMRRSEVLSLTWDQVDMKNRVLDLKAEETKTGEPRTIPMGKELYEILRAIPRNLHDKHVFTYQGKPVSDIRRALKTACKKVEIKYGRFERDGFVFHDLRRTFNTHLRKAGVPESVIMKITGHKTRIMFDRYNVVDEEDKRRAVDQLGAFLENVDQNVDHGQKKADPR